MNSTARLNRLFAADGKCFDVALDHGFFNGVGFLAGLENMERAIHSVVQAAPDALQLSPGQASILQAIPGKAKPALVLRTDVANVYGATLPRYLFSKLVEQAALQAVRLDAACLCVNLFLLPDQPEIHAQCLENVAKLKLEAESYGMPLMVEPLVMRDNAEAGGYMVDGTLEKILPLVRQAVELGADVIKADPSERLEDYHRVIEVAGRVPVLVRGGGRASEAEILQRTHAVMKQGAKGIVYGRNVVQHENPTAMTRALMAIVHEDATPEAATRLLKGPA